MNPEHIGSILGRVMPAAQPPLRVAFPDEASAIAALQETRARLIADARAVAAELATRDGWTTAAAVFREMDARGLMDDSDRALNARWLGACFRGPRWHSLGTIKVGLSERNAHPAPRQRWALREGT